MNRRKRDKSNHRNRDADASTLFERRGAETLIDGYNLLHLTRFKPLRHGGDELRRCREGLLNFLAEKLPSGQEPYVTLVFDANHAPAHLEKELLWRQLRVRFAHEQNTADDLIIELLHEHARPSALVVVSSDHRVQVAAQRKKATAVDSDVWFDALLSHSFSSPTENPRPETIEPPKPLDDEFEENPFPEGFFDEVEKEFRDES